MLSALSAFDTPGMEGEHFAISVMKSSSAFELQVWIVITYLHIEWAFGKLAYTIQYH